MANWWDIWSHLFVYGDFMARRYCGAWSPELIRLHRVSDLLIWLAYLAIPIVLVSFAWKRRTELPFHKVFLLFALFIVSCGTTHLIDAFMFDFPLYRLMGVVKLITAAASWGTVIALIPIVPVALQMKSPEVLQREVNERERAEAEVRVLNDELLGLNTRLEARVRERTIELEDVNARLAEVNRGLEQANEEKDELLVREQNAREEAERASRSKDEFLATLSHELRTPLNSIMGWSVLLSSGKLDEESTEEAIETIERSTRAQARLIEDMLDVSRIITGKLTLEMQDVQPAPIIEAALTSVRPAAQVKGIVLNFQTHTADTVWADAHRLQQIMWNLLSNAIKFTPPDGQVSVSLQRVESQLEIAVSDTGEGISAHVLPRIFERFWQSDSSSTRTHGGMGLGLAIVRHLVELHGGQISAESAGLQRGTTFKVQLPLRAAINTDASHELDAPRPENAEVRALTQSATHSATQSVAQVVAPQLLESVRVLTVDDEPDARAVVATSLKRFGAEVRTADSAAKALDVFRQWQPDILLSDIGMPEEDGYSLLTKIRALPDDIGMVPAIALTAYASSADRERVLQAGFGAYVTKPANPDELAATVASLLGRS